MAQGSEEHQGSSFGGVSLPSFLQMLEQERKSCTLIVNSESRSGSFYFEDGELIDAVFDDQLGMDAAHSILLWSNPTFKVGMPEDKMRRIQRPLAHLLLDSAKRMDEEEGESEEDPQSTTHSFQIDESIIKADPLLQKLVDTITSISGVRHFYFLDRQGKVITQSSRKQKLGDFITYCIVSGIQMRKILDAKGPNRIHLNLDNGETLLIIPGAGLIIGLLLDELASVNDVTEQLRPALTTR